MTMIGIIILAVAVYSFSSATGDASGVDAILESQHNSGAKLKSMVWLVVGTCVSIAGVLWSLLSFSRSSGSK